MPLVQAQGGHLCGGGAPGQATRMGLDGAPGHGRGKVEAPRNRPRFRPRARAFARSGRLLWPVGVLEAQLSSQRRPPHPHGRFSDLHVQVRAEARAGGACAAPLIAERQPIQANDAACLTLGLDRLLEALHQCVGARSAGIGDPGPAWRAWAAALRAARWPRPRRGRQRRRRGRTRRDQAGDQAGPSRRRPCRFQVVGRGVPLKSTSASGSASVASTVAPARAATRLGSPSPQPSSTTRRPRRPIWSSARASATPLRHRTSQYGASGAQRMSPSSGRPATSLAATP